MNKINHQNPKATARIPPWLWSFDDVFDYKELEKWEEKVLRMIGKAEEVKGVKVEKVEYVCEVKIDGLKIIYERNKK